MPGWTSGSGSGIAYSDSPAASNACALLASMSSRVIIPSLSVGPVLAIAVSGGTDREALVNYTPGRS